MRRPRVVLLCALSAATVTACGEDDRIETERFEPTVAEILRAPPKFTRNVVEVEGTVTPVKELGFVLRQGDDRIFVNVPPPMVRRLVPGDRVTVTGVVQRITAAGERRLATARDVVLSPGDDAEPASKAARRAVRKTPTDTGDPYIDGETIGSSKAGDKLPPPPE